MEHSTLPSDVEHTEHSAMNAQLSSTQTGQPAPKHRSFTSIIVKLTGDIIAYKTKMHVTVALSSTEAEYMATCDVGKMMLFNRKEGWHPS